MGDQTFKIEQASPECLEEALEILTQALLPHDGVREHFGGFLVARSEDGRILGCVGLERYGEVALLRSAAVRAEAQGGGVGNKLIRKLLEQASEEGIAEIGLLTTTAKNYFQDKFGFEEANRGGYQERLAGSPEWNLPRCSSAVFMVLKLKSREESLMSLSDALKQ